MASVETYATYFGLQAERLTSNPGGAKYYVGPAKGYRFTNGWRPAFTATASEAKQAVNVLMNIRQECDHCGTPRRGAYGNVRDA